MNSNPNVWPEELHFGWASFQGKSYQDLQSECAITFVRRMRPKKCNECLSSIRQACGHLRCRIEPSSSRQRRGKTSFCGRKSQLAATMCSTIGRTAKLRDRLWLRI